MAKGLGFRGLTPILGNQMEKGLGFRVRGYSPNNEESNGNEIGNSG